MYNMMSTTGAATGFIFLWAVHVLAVILFSVGVLFLVLWAIKKLTPAELKKWGINFIVGGAVLCLLTIGAMGHVWSSTMMGGNYGPFPGMMQNFNR